MADNVVLNSNTTTGDTLAADEIASVKHQRVKVQHGADGSATDVSTASPMPVDIRTDNASLATAANQATANTALAAIQTAVQILDNVVSGNEAQVDIVTSALPTGASTAANQSTANTALAAIQTAVETLDNIVSGSEAQVDVVAHPADTFVAEAGSLGKGVLLQGDDGTDRKNVNVDATTGDMQVDVTNSVTIGSSALPSGAATAANQSTANTALAAIQTAVEVLDNIVSGSEAQVDVVTSALPTGAATAANQSTANTALSAIQTAVQIIDNAISGNEMQVDVVTDQPLDRAADNVGAALQTDVIMSDTTALTPKFANISTASSGNTAVIAAVASKTTRILALTVIASASTNDIYFNDGIDDLLADATRKIPLSADGSDGPVGFTLPFNPVGWFETGAINRAVNINLGSTNGVVGKVIYVEV